METARIRGPVAEATIGLAGMAAAVAIVTKVILTGSFAGRAVTLFSSVALLSVPGWVLAVCFVASTALFVHGIYRTVKAIQNARQLNLPSDGESSDGESSVNSPRRSQTDPEAMKSNPPGDDDQDLLESKDNSSRAKSPDGGDGEESQVSNDTMGKRAFVSFSSSQYPNEPEHLLDSDQDLPAPEYLLDSDDDQELPALLSQENSPRVESPVEDDGNESDGSQARRNDKDLQAVNEEIDRLYLSTVLNKGINRTCLFVAQGDSSQGAKKLENSLGQSSMDMDGSDDDQDFLEGISQIGRNIQDVNEEAESLLSSNGGFAQQVVLSSSSSRGAEQVIESPKGGIDKPENRSNGATSIGKVKEEEKKEENVGKKQNNRRRKWKNGKGKGKTSHNKADYQK